MSEWRQETRRVRNRLRERWNALHQLGTVAPCWRGEEGYQAFATWVEEQGMTPEQVFFRLHPERPHGPDNTRVGDKTLNAITTRLRCTNTSGHRGVSYDSNRDKWQAHLTCRRKQYHGPRRDTLEEAVADRREMERKYFEPLLEEVS